MLAPRDLLSTVAPGLLRIAPSPEAGENKEPGSHHQGGQQNCQAKDLRCYICIKRVTWPSYVGPVFPPPSMILPRMRPASTALASLRHSPLGLLYMLKQLLGNSLMEILKPGCSENVESGETSLLDPIGSQYIRAISVSLSKYLCPHVQNQI